jgi:hypothetical protein
MPAGDNQKSSLGSETSKFRQRKAGKAHAKEQTGAERGEWLNVDLQL